MEVSKLSQPMFRQIRICEWGYFGFEKLALQESRLDLFSQQRMDNPFRGNTRVRGLLTDCLAAGTSASQNRSRFHAYAGSANRTTMAGARGWQQWRFFHNNVAVRAT